MISLLKIHVIGVGWAISYLNGSLRISIRTFYYIVLISFELNRGKRCENSIFFFHLRKIGAINCSMNQNSLTIRPFFLKRLTSSTRIVAPIVEYSFDTLVGASRKLYEHSRGKCCDHNICRTQ